MRAGAVLVASLAVAGTVAVSGADAGPYDGVYVTGPAGDPPDPAACAAVEVLIAGDAVRYFDIRCALANPVQIRAMDAVLYDGTCRLDGTEKAGRVLIRRMASGDVALVTPYMDLRLTPCDVAG